MDKIDNYEQYVVTFIIGYLAYFLPKDGININPLYSSIIIGTFFSYVLYSDLEINFFNLYDFILLLLVITMAILGGLLAGQMKKAEQIYTVSL